MLLLQLHSSPSSHAASSALLSRNVAPDVYKQTLSSDRAVQLDSREPRSAALRNGSPTHPAHPHSPDPRHRASRPARRTDDQSGVSRYSTAGGTVPCRCRLISPLPSISRNVWVSIFLETPGRLRCNTPLRAAPPMAGVQRMQDHAGPLGREQRQHPPRRAILAPLLFGDPGCMVVTSWCLGPHSVPSRSRRPEPPSSVCDNIEKTGMAGTALVVGASGIVGSATASAAGRAGLDGARPCTPTDRPARRPPVAADLQDAPATAAALAGRRSRRGVHHHLAAAGQRGGEHPRQRRHGPQPAGRPARRASTRHVALVTGLKHYLGPFEAYGKGTLPQTPFREEQGRLTSRTSIMRRRTRCSPLRRATASLGACTARTR